MTKICTFMGQQYEVTACAEEFPCIYIAHIICGEPDYDTAQDKLFYTVEEMNDEFNYIVENFAAYMLVG